MNSIFIVFLISLITTYKDVCFVQKAMQIIAVQLWEWLLLYLCNMNWFDS